MKYFSNFQIPFDTVEEAYASARRADIIGYVHFQSNFTESTDYVQEKGRQADEGSIENSRINIRLDMSNQQVAYFLERKLRETFGDFAKNVMNDCEFPEKLGSIPVRFENPVFGTFDAEFREYAAPGVVMT